MVELKEGMVLRSKIGQVTMINWHRLDWLESIEERDLYSAVLGVSPIRIGRTSPVRFQPESNFSCEIMKQVSVVG